MADPVEAQKKDDLPDSRCSDRRNFLKNALGAGLAVLALNPVKKSFAKVKSKIKGPRYAMLVDLNRCIGCKSCTVACKSENNVPLGVFRTKVNDMEQGKYPKAKRYFAPIMCNHCAQPPCVDVCPVDPVKAVYRRPDGVQIEYDRRATYKRPDGLVLMDDKRCIGCHLCVQNCPYGARFIDPGRKAGANPDNQTVGKCNYCVHRIDQGVIPSCVQTCLGGALLFGDIHDPSSEISQRLKKEKHAVWKPEDKTLPHTFYIGLKDKNVLGEEVNPRV